MKKIVLLFCLIPYLIAASYPIPIPGTSGNVMTSNGSRWVSSSAVAVATATAITDDTTTNATMYPTWVTASTGNLPQKVSSSKMTFNPSSGTLTATTFSGALTGTASGNLQATANQYGVLLSGAANTAVVLAPDASTTKVLTSGGASANPTWAAPAGGPPAFNYTAQTGTYSAVIGDAVRVTSGTFTITLPTAVSQAGKYISVKNVGSGLVTIATTSAQTIFVAGSALASGVIKMATAGDFVSFVSDGANWYTDSFDVFVGARAHTSATTISGTAAEIVCGTETYDSTGDHNVSTGRYTASIPGTYWASGCIYADATSAADDLVQTYIYRGGAGIGIERVDRMSGDRSNISFCVQGTIKLAAGEYASLWFNMAGSGQSQATSRTHFEIRRVGN